MSSSIGFSIFLRARSARTPVVVADVHRRGHHNAAVITGRHHTGSHHTDCHVASGGVGARTARVVLAAHVTAFALT
jgi:hypothetical protein